MAAHYVEFLPWAGYALAGIGGWRYIPLAVVRLTAAFTSNEMRHRRCMEVLRLTRRDAAQIPTYLPAANETDDVRPAEHILQAEIQRSDDRGLPKAMCTAMSWARSAVPPSISTSTPLMPRAVLLVEVSLQEVAGGGLQPDDLAELDVLFQCDLEIVDGLFPLVHGLLAVVGHQPGQVAASSTKGATWRRSPSPT